MSFTEDFNRGVNPFRDQVAKVIKYMNGFVRNPFDGMRNLPNWDWSTLFIFYIATAAASGAISGILSLKISQIFIGIIIFPIAATIGGTIQSVFFYYVFSFFFKRELPLRLFFTIVFLSTIPYFVIHTLAGIVEPINLIGFAATSILLIIGLSENTQVDKKKIVRLIGAMYIIYFLFWAFSLISFKNETKKYKTLATPESIDKLREEFSD